MKKVLIALFCAVVIILLVDLLIYKNNNVYVEKQKELNNFLEKNVFEVISINKAIKLINDETGIIYLTDDDSISYTKLLNELAISLNINKIYYVDLTHNIDDSKLTELLENNVEVNKKKFIITPTILVVNDGALKNSTNLNDYSGYELDKKIISILSNYGVDDSKEK